MPDDGHRLRNNPSLVLRLVRGAVLWALPALALSAFALTWFYRASTYRLFDEPLDSTITALIAFADTAGTRGGRPDVTLTREPIDPRYQQALSGRYWLIGILSADGNIIPLQASRSMARETLKLSGSDARMIMASPGKGFERQLRGLTAESL